MSLVKLTVGEVQLLVGSSAPVVPKKGGRVKICKSRLDARLGASTFVRTDQYDGAVDVPDRRKLCNTKRRDQLA